MTEACHTEGRNGARARSINGGLLVQPARKGEKAEVRRRGESGPRASTSSHLAR